MNEIMLCQQYSEWCRLNHLPAMSASELVLKDLTPAQHAWLVDFLARWDALFKPAVRT
jgi:hypothetical protein